MEFEFETKRYLSGLIERYGWEIGSHTYGNPVVMEHEWGRLRIGRFCSIAHNTTLILGNHRKDLASTYPFRTLHGFWPGAEAGLADHDTRSDGIEIGNDVWLGANCTVLPGVKIGDGAIIASAAVVTKDVPPYAIVAGNPAQVKKYRFDDNTIQKMISVEWWSWSEEKVRRFIPALTSLEGGKFADFAIRQTQIEAMGTRFGDAELSLCSQLWGAAEIRESEPMVAEHKSILYTPFQPDKKWGIYDVEGFLIPDSVDFRGPEALPNSQDISRIERGQDSTPILDDAEYVYVGRINPHFGHFLINSLPRFWTIHRQARPDVKLVYHGHHDPCDWFQLDFMREIFKGLGVTPGSFIPLTEPTIIPRLTIPQTSLMEQHYAYQAYRDLCVSVGQKIMHDALQVEASDVIYYSKQKLPNGVGRIVNEYEIENVMEAQGIKVIHPETLTFAEQLQTLASASVVLGTAGSFIHNVIFLANPPKLIVINPTPDINSNYAILDKLSDVNVDYIYPDKIEVLKSSDARFLTSRYIPNAHSVGEVLCGLAKEAVGS